MNYFLAAMTYLVSLAVIAVICFYVVWFVAGPHSGFLPGWMERVVGVTGWLLVIFLPLWFARRVWIRLNRS